MLEVWQPPTTGDNGRGIDVDREGRVYVAGGPMAEVRVFDREGRSLAELPTGAAGSFLNDVWVGNDGVGLRDRLLAAVDLARDPTPRAWRDRACGATSPARSPTRRRLTDFDLGGIVDHEGHAC